MTQETAELLEGARQIADATGFGERRVFNLLEQKLMPAFKLGGRWYARRRTLEAWLAALERGEAA